ncbi:HAMP domain-containing histidine kinase [Pseudomonas corrugata]|uniref:histidine kinase n=1 Tax=Pseudomonas corrugata TaxID=47879 RepID=A0A8B6UKK2_9PSED|nr:HAMP domain-containing sensor histidine kinase [Pseudomonas corrugata]AOE61273.1 histidine kinase [Pseudomonas corrugata]MDU9023470.1 HAMP domain-containing sensor histidine kinase [Pseudomonas corrugata]MDU9032782.1 HAMP domain-containing sensor histidine kinase [Pseudomonas corrugata]MDU9038144.1 HAMP domain-containing sensor histidine kinase [Pseudomonas corrugata]QTH12429.1 HAMP domain-containing histidine kinase [Pseudomonas corrugata]
MKPSSSLQKRLGLGLTLGMTLLWLGATVGAWLVVQHELNEAFDSALEETAQRILPLAVLEISNREGPREAQHVATLKMHKEYLTYLVRDASGQILMQSHDANPNIFNQQPIEGFSTSEKYRLYGASALRGTLFIEIAEPLGHRREAAREALFALLLPLLALIPVSLLGTWLFVRISLRSVLAYRRAVEARGVGDLSPIKVARLPAEIDPLAEAVNHLLERLRKALEAERSFTANSAHELRTPLAATLAQIQRLHHEAPEGPLRVRAAKIENALRELVRLSEKLMQLAKAEGGGLLSETPQDLIPLLAHGVDEWNQRSGQRIELHLPGQASVYSNIDPDAFGILLRNLIENALKYGAADQPIEVSLTEQALLRVVNGGPAVPQSVLQHLTERFVRGHSEISGSGLGLAITKTIVQGVNARMKLVSPATGRQEGFEVCVWLPLAWLQPGRP